MSKRIERILELFERIDRVPRKSKKEEQIAAWILEWAGGEGFRSKRDAAGNVLVSVPSSPGLEAAPTVVLQGHMDMVCEKTPDSKHDFEKDPIAIRRDGEWLRADGTTLGADNGIAIAMAMAAATSKDVPHPPLELLFTIDEESGLTGALNLAEGFIEGRVLLNLDSEDEGIFTIGSAGGRRTVVTLPVRTVAPPRDEVQVRMTVSGLQGGHSGVDIGKHRANANKLLARLAHRITAKHPVRLIWFDSRAADNAICRSATACFAVGPAGETLNAVTAEVSAFEDAVRNEYRSSEPGLRITSERLSEPIEAALAPETARTMLALLLAHPHGVMRMSPEIPELVQTSANLAAAYVEKGELSMLSLQRSSVQSELDGMLATINAIGELAGATVKIESEYPGWEPRLSSPLLKRSIAIYRKRFGTEPVVEAVHAGLECGVIGGKYPGMDMISFGPTIVAPHSPDERLNIPSLEKTWTFLVDLLQSFAGGTA